MKRLRQEKGMVLLLVLVVVTLLASLLTEFAFSTLVDLRLTETFRDSTRAWYLARGGITVGRTILQQDKNGYDAPGDPEEFWAQGVANYPVGEGAVSISIEDLGGKLDLNRLVSTGGGPDSNFTSRAWRLFDQLGLDAPEDLVAALVDWLDGDPAELTGFTLDIQQGNTRQVTANGAEDNYYRNLASPYRAKNNVMDSLEELALVRGFTPEVRRKLAPYVTVHGGPDSFLNVNSASAEVLLSWNADMTRADAEKIVEARREQPFTNTSQLSQLLGTNLYSSFNRNDDVAFKSPTYRILATAQVNDGARQVEAIVEKAGDKLLYLKVN